MARFPRFAALLTVSTAIACASGPTTRSPASADEVMRGHLLIVGGGPIPDSIVRRFVELAGGAARARVIIFPMASEDPESGVEMAERLHRLGASVERLSLGREEASSDRAAQRLEGATGIWFGGGDQSRLTAALLHTPVETAIRRLYREGAVVGGTSAGAAVMSTPMLTGEERRPGGDRPSPKDSSDAYMTIARENVETAEGFGLLPGAIVDQHFVRRRRHNRLLSLVLENPSLVGVGIDESTALEVGPDGIWRVLGANAAVVFDARQARITPERAPLGAAGVRLHVLPSGSTFDAKTGRATLPGSGLSDPKSLSSPEKPG